MKHIATSPEGRQHINISQFAYDVIRNDALNFMGGINISGFINRIVSNAKIDSFDDLLLMEEERLSEEYSMYIKPGRTCRLNEEEKELINKMAIAHRNRIITSYEKYPKNIPLKIRLNNSLHDEFYPMSDIWEGIKLGITPGEYIKVIIENYARQTFFDRERIFFKNTIENLEKYTKANAEDKRILMITLSNNKRFLLKPYRLSKEYEANYHYIIGLATEDGNKEYIPSSFRLSRIIDIKQKGRSIGSGNLNKAEIKDVESRIKAVGVQYILGEPVAVTVKLTPSGMIMYNSIFHQRPVYDSIESNRDGSFILMFNTTKRQVTNYFFTFGKEAEILTPTDLREWMCKKYQDASNHYM
ncbi:MAG: WYL domain-containing protein [Saccharofermentans sp.]|nr:WYL domain-containing protein [Saccharofermentans sp.]